MEDFPAHMWTRAEDQGPALISEAHHGASRDNRLSLSMERVTVGACDDGLSCVRVGRHLCSVGCKHLG